MKRFKVMIPDTFFCVEAETEEDAQKVVYSTIASYPNQVYLVAWEDANITDEELIGEV